MHRRSDRKRILFVDDEPSIRVTLPPVIEQSGFEVRVAATVPDALFEINSYEFDALLADLNISEEGDGFLVVSAMRHLQPNCVNVILTGYPALETAVQAIRNQVDDYLIKPAEVDLIVSTIRDRLENRRPRPTALKNLPAIVKENVAQLGSRILQAMKRHPLLSALPLSDEERMQHLSKLISGLLQHLEAQTDPDPANATLQHLAVEYGRVRKKQGYTPAMIFIDFQLVRQAIYDVVETRMMTTDLAGLIPDLKKLEDRTGVTVQKALEPYGRARRASASR
jgi:ActR/RegA family two-component response regulator